MNKNAPFHPGDQVVAYFRDSGGDKQELSVSRQEDEFRRWCQENGLIPGQVFKDEARPGSSVVSRSQFQAMMHHFRSGNIPEVGLVIWNYQRFAREIDDSQFFRADIRRRGYIFYSLNDDVPEGPMGRVYEALLDWKNEQFLLDLSSDVKSGLRSLVERYGAIPGTPPRGFARKQIQISTHRDGRPRIAHRWEPDPNLIPIIRQAFDMLLAGASLAEIQQATHLYNSVNSFQTFFSNPLYKGILEYSDLVVEGYCEPIIDLATWDQAQVIIGRRARRKHLSGDNPNHPRRNGAVYILSGLVYCAHCGSPLSGLSIKQSSGSRYERYSCSRQKRNHDCDAETIPRIFLEDLIVKITKENILTPDNLENQRTIILQTETERKIELQERITAQRSQLTAIRRRIGNIADTLAEEGKSRALLTKLAELEATETDCLSEIAKLETHANENVKPMDDQTIESICERLQFQLTESPKSARQILRGLYNRILVERDGPIVQIQFEYFYPPEEKPPNDDIISSVQPPLGAPSQRYTFSLSISVPFQRKKYTRNKRP